MNDARHRGTVEAQVREQIRPNDEEKRLMAATLKRLKARIRAALDDAGVDAEPTVQGSMAKGTWLAGNADVDLFLLMPVAASEAELAAVPEKIAGKVLENPRRRYAQHPYVIGEFEGFQVDLVPAYRIETAEQRLSAVDRTPLHTAWVNEHLDAAAKDDVRLLKQWMKGTGVYGAQTAQGGFSGYLVEVLVEKLGSMDAVLEWLAKGAPAFQGDAGLPDSGALLRLADPVDPGRNVAAGVQPTTLEQATKAATAYIRAPGRPFFFPQPATPLPVDMLRAELAKQNATWIGLLLPATTERLDIVFPQFQRAAKTIVQHMERSGFQVHRNQVAELPDGQIAMQWILDATLPPGDTLHRGPPANTKHAARFREKWHDHPDAISPIETGPDGRLEVRVANRLQTPHAWMQHTLGHLVLGKHFSACLPGQTLHDIADVEQPAWQAQLADLVLDRQPWER